MFVLCMLLEIQINVVITHWLVLHVLVRIVPTLSKQTYCHRANIYICLRSEDEDLLAIVGRTLAATILNAIVGRALAATIPT